VFTTKLTLILRGLAFHWRAHLAAALAAAVGTAVLVGALLVGDSVRFSLKTMALERLGQVDKAIISGDRFFRADLADRLLEERAAPGDPNSPPPLGEGRGEGSRRAEPVLFIKGTCAVEGGQSTAGDVQIVGVRDSFWQLGEHGPATPPKPGEIVLNQRLAAQLGAKVGDEIRVRVPKPGQMSYDAPISSTNKTNSLLRATVKEIISDRGFGRFGLDASQIVPRNAFVPLADLQKAMVQPGRANLLLTSGCENCERTVLTKWSLDDAQLKLRTDAKLGFVELSTPRVFLEDALTTPLLHPRTRKPKTEKADGKEAKADSSAEPRRAAQIGGVLTYFVNAIRAVAPASVPAGATNETPYSMVTAGAPPLVPADLEDDEIILNDWTAQDLKAKSGDKIDLEYYVAGTLRKLETRTARFTVKAVVPLDGLHADRGLMPDFPGIADVDSTHDWDSGIPINMKKIRPKDEDYWKQYRGTPKAFISLSKGVQLWGNRFGHYTALRFPIQGNPAAAQATTDRFLRRHLDPATFGLKFLPVREIALHASAQAIDFGMLFLGFSFFLIVAALLLMALIFRFNLESRATETGLLLALGFRPRTVRNLFWAEGTLMAAIGSLVGVGLGTLYAQAMLHALATRWVEAVGTSLLEFHAEPLSLAIGLLSGIAAAALTIFIAARKQTGTSARELLASANAEPPPAAIHRRRWIVTLLVCAIAAAALLALRVGGEDAAGRFFGAGALILIACLSMVRLILAAKPTDGETGRRGDGGTSAAEAKSQEPRAKSQEPRGPFTTLLSLGIRAATRRSGRSLATAALLACGSFMVVAVGANRKDAAAGAERKDSGTGGFALIASSTLPVFEDLNTQSGRTNAGVSDTGLQDVALFPLRVHSGDEASCLNLNRPQQPRIVGAPDSLIKRGGFSFAALLPGAEKNPNPWTFLHAEPQKDPDQAVPAICDFQSLTWALHMKVGDELSITDESGKPRRVRIVGALAESILQGGIVISEAGFLQLYPSESGYRQFLIDAPPERAEAVARTLENGLQDEGFSATPTARKLAEFAAVENTYLSTFQALGSLGLLLGSLGLGIVVLRNVLERRSELALMRALGFSRSNLTWMVLSEHLWLLLLGLGSGVLAALIAVLPLLLCACQPVPWGTIAGSLAAIFACGLAAAFLASWAMLRAPLLSALRNE
jgi:ABC-type antimicrobial peptide transport system permease subunit